MSPQILARLFLMAILALKVVSSSSIIIIPKFLTLTVMNSQALFPLLNSTLATMTLILVYRVFVLPPNTLGFVSLDLLQSLRQGFTDSK